MYQGGEGALQATCVGFDSLCLHCRNGAAGPRGRRRLRRSEIGVQFPGGPLHWAHGPNGTDTSSAGWRSGFKSRWVHCYPDGERDIISRFEREGPGSNPGRGSARDEGRASRPATAPGWKPDERNSLAGSIPAPSAGRARNRRVAARVGKPFCYNGSEGSTPSPSA